jgi:hypothetical protein
MRRDKYSLLFAYHVQLRSEAEHCHGHHYAEIVCLSCAGGSQSLFSIAMTYSRGSNVWYCRVKGLL